MLPDPSRGRGGDWEDFFSHLHPGAHYSHALSLSLSLSLPSPFTRPLGADRLASIPDPKEAGFFPQGFGGDGTAVPAPYPVPQGDGWIDPGSPLLVPFFSSGDHQPRTPSDSLLLICCWGLNKRGRACFLQD
jgi:hypothetical protein